MLVAIHILGTTYTAGEEPAALRGRARETVECEHRSLFVERSASGLWIEGDAPGCPPCVCHDAFCHGI